MDVSPGSDEDAELVIPDDELVSGPADPKEFEAALLAEEAENLIDKLKQLILKLGNCGVEDWESRGRKIRFDLEEWLLRMRIAEAQQSPGRAATESGIFTSDMRAVQVAVSGGRFKLDGRDDPLESNYAHENRTKWNTARKHAERRSDVYKLTARAWAKSEEWLRTLLLMREIERKANGDMKDTFIRAFPTVAAEIKRKANCMEPSEKERLLELYDNRDLSGWFDEEVWPRIVEMGEEAISKEYPGAINRAKSIQNERPGAAKDTFRRSLMGALQRPCKHEFVDIIGPEEFPNNT